MLLPIGVAEAALATDVAIQNNIYGLGITTLIISNEEMKDIKILNWIENEAK